MFPELPEDTWWLFSLKIDAACKLKRDRFLFLIMLLKCEAFGPTLKGTTEKKKTRSDNFSSKTILSFVGVTK